MSGDGYTFLGYPVGTGSGTVAAGDHTHASLAALAVAGNTVYPQPSIPADRGYIAWNMPVYAATGAAALTTAGTLYLMRIERVPAAPVTNIVMHCTAAGNTLTAGQCFACLYTAAGALIGTTADQSAAWASLGEKIMPLTGGPYTVAAGAHYAGFWFNGTTGPTFTRYTNSIGNATLLNAGTIAPNFIAASANTGRTTTAPNPFSTQGAFSAQWWVALS